MRVILDTNIIVSALLSPSGFPAKVLNLVLTGAIKLVYDNGILAEYVDVLYRKKFKIDNELIDFLIDFISKEGEYGIAKPQKVNFDDEDDRRFFELYKSEDVDYLITGNKKHYPRENGIVTPRVFIENLYQDNI